MLHKNLTANQGDPIYQKGAIMRKVLTPVFLIFLLVAAWPFQAYSEPINPLASGVETTLEQTVRSEPTYPISTDVETTRQRTVRPLIAGPEELKMWQVEEYAPNGYSSWEFGKHVDAGPLLPDGSAVGTYNPIETLLTFFSMSDIHITDKESPAQLLYSGVTGTFGDTDISDYSPIILSTTHVLDAAVQTINVLHTPDTL